MEDLLAQLASASSRIALFFELLAGSATFAGIVWEHEPLLAHGALAMLPNESLTWPDVQATAAAGLLAHSSSNLFTTPVGGGCASSDSGTACPQSFSTEVIEHGDLISESELMQRLALGSTFSVGRAGAVWPAIARIAAVATRTFTLAANVNIYVTLQNSRMALPRHNDRQDTIILQMEGCKVWTLHRAAAPLPTEALIVGKRSSARPIDLGNGSIRMSRVELRRGDALYVPRGLIHETSTACLSTATSSVHATLGLETEVVSFTYNRAAVCALGLALIPSGHLGLLASAQAVLTAAESEAENVPLRSTAPVGFLAAGTSLSAASTRLHAMLLELILPRLPPAEEAQMRVLLQLQHSKKSLSILRKAAKALAGRYAEALEGQTGGVRAHSAAETDEAQLSMQRLVRAHSVQMLGKCGFAVTNPNQAAVKPPTSTRRGRDEL